MSFPNNKKYYCPKCGCDKLENDRNRDNEMIEHKFFCPCCKFRGWIVEKEIFSETEEKRLTIT